VCRSANRPSLTNCSGAVDWLGIPRRRRRRDADSWTALTNDLAGFDAADARGPGGSYAARLISNVGPL
jgi:hypothetical protein